LLEKKKQVTEEFYSIFDHGREKNQEDSWKKSLRSLRELEKKSTTVILAGDFQIIQIQWISSG